MITVVLFGAGKVARQLCAAFSKTQNIQVIQCYNRKGIVLAPDIPTTSSLDTLKEAAIYLLCIHDRAIAEVSRHIPKTTALVVHTAGAVSIATIASKHRAGVWYPLQTFSIENTIDFKTVPLCIEADTKEDLALLYTMAAALSTKIYELSSEQRNALHLAAVFVNNFTNHLYTIGNEICNTNQLPFEILYPLIQETTKKILTLPPNTTQTGPAIRKDQETIAKHLERLAHPTHKKIYTLLTQTIQEYYDEKL